MIVNEEKENVPNSGLRYDGSQSRNKNKMKRDKYLALSVELKKALDQEGNGDTKCYWRVWNGPQKAW